MSNDAATASDAGARAWDCVRATNILHSFALGVDAMDLPAVVDCFAPDAELVTPRSSARGHTEIENFFRGAWAADPSRKRHFVTSPRTTWVEPGLVRVEAYFWYSGRLPGRSVIGWGEYDDLVDVCGDRPVFRRISMRSELATDLAAGWPAASD